MTQAALIILDEDRPTAPVLGLSWPEFQLRRAARAGALHLVLVSDRVTRDVVEAVDRLRSEGLSTTLARSNAEVADLFHPDEAVLLLTGNQVVSDAQLAALLNAPKPALLCVDPARAQPMHELIDGRSHWIGIGRVNGAHIRATVPLAGDWDLGSTLLRKAVAARASRVMLGEDDLLLPATDAVRVARALTADTGDRPRGWGQYWLVAPLAHLLARSLPNLLPLSVRGGVWAALAGFAAAPLFQVAGWTAVALALYLLALLIGATARIAASTCGIPLRRASLLAHAPHVGGMALLAAIVVPLLPELAPVVLALNAVGLLALAGRIGSIAETRDARWLADPAGCATILFGASLFGTEGLIVGLAAIVLHGFVTLAHLQNRLSRALTSPR